MALRAFDGDRPRDAANVKSARERLSFDPLDEFLGHVPIGGFFDRGEGFFEW